MEHLNKVIQSLDSIWFYTNLFSSSTTNPFTIVSDDYVIIKSETPKSDPSKPTTPIQKTQIPIDSVIQEFPKSSDFVSERNRVSKETWEGRDKKERRIRKKKKRSKGNSDQRRRVVNWVDFGFDSNEIDEFCMKMNGMIMNMNLPSFSDEMAMTMRQHLKSWAHSVACAVK